MKIFNKIAKYKWFLIITIVFAGGVYYYTQIYNNDGTSETVSFYVVDTVEKGEVTSGIETTGDIVAAQTLDLDVYKLSSRIDVLNISDGSHVEEGDVLLSFDKSDAYVNTQSSSVSVAEARLALQEAEENATDPSIEIRNKKNSIEGYEKSIADTEQDIKDAYRDFLNEDLEFVPYDDTYGELDSRTEPTLSGRYVSDEQGVYIVKVYASGADSGFSFRVTGLETTTEYVIFGKAIDLGTRGLKITFPTDTKSGDEWIVYIPNTEISTYDETKQDYEKQVANYEETIRNTEVNLINARQELEDLINTDTSTYRDLTVEQAEASLAEAQQRLSENYDSVEERDVVAPFTGTVEGMQNVVEGATPTGDSSDTISLGTLISDEFIATFSLGATDVAKVSVGQRVKVTVTSFTEQPEFEATITQISSLPQSSGVAQYEVEALLNYDKTTAEIKLREGMLADIEIVEEENSEAIRIPTSAITYEDGVPMVSVVDGLTDEQQKQAEKMGIVRTEGTSIYAYDVEVELGIIGDYYVEVISGLSEGDIIVTSSLTQSTEETESVVGQAGFGPGSGARNNSDTPPEGAPAN